MQDKDLPTLIKLQELLNVVPYSKPSIYRMMANGNFPKPIKLGQHSRSVFWLKEDIEKFIYESIQQSKGDAA